MFVRPTVVLSFVFALLISVFAAGSADAVTFTSMAAVGDSITRAYNTGPSAYSDYPTNSWSTGSSATVRSQAVRLSVPQARAFNDAVSGAKMTNLNSQITTVNGHTGVEYVTILMGGNDVCTSTEGSMTTVESFTTDFKLAMSTLAKGSPNAKVFVASIPDVSKLWSLFKGNSTARFYWSIFGICQSMLKNPTSTQPADNDRRANVIARNKAFNGVLRTVCGTYSTSCLYDNDAVYNFQFGTADVSNRDYFHPSVSGQTRLACVAWEMSYGGKNPGSC
jgi:lysophospholipase L1-like esterase